MPPHPNKQLGFEISPSNASWTFVPEFYPKDFSTMKSKELDRYASGCNGESVSIKMIKNREFHITGLIIQGEVDIFNSLLDYDGKVNLLSPLTPSGGMECFIKKGELGNQEGWDPHKRQWMFKFTLDLVSTGRDEAEGGKNQIVTEIMGQDPDSFGSSVRSGLVDDDNQVGL